ncbi:MAG TPA: hypothetical protein VKA10_01115 [Prolixibacteraceae bacterium]|nr:hypothetical protein [Prolixibacteraceae bacterium]
MKKTKIYLLLLVGVVLFAGCASQSLEQIVDPPGFLYGLLHGFIILFSFIGSLFMDIDIYAFPNNGAWYNFGYLLGTMIFFGGGGAGSRKRR